MTSVKCLQNVRPKRVFVARFVNVTEDVLARFVIITGTREFALASETTTGYGVSESVKFKSSS